MKKIGIVIDWYLPRIGGAEVYAYNLAKYLQKSGYEVSVFTLDEKNTKDYQDDFNTTRVDFGKGLKGKIKFYKELKKFLDEVDIIHAVYSHKFAAYAGIYNIFKKKPFAITLQGRGILDLPGNNFVYGLVHSFYRWFSLKVSDYIIASCQDFVDIAKKYTSEKKIKYIPNAVDLETFQKTEIPTDLEEKYKDNKVVLTVRRLVPKNGIQFLVESSPKIVEKNKDVKFVLVGYGQLEEYLKQRAEELGVRKHFDFVGKVENKLVPGYLSLAKVVVFPSTAESTSLACLEAMAMKKALVASRVGGYLEMVEDNKTGYLVKLVDWENSDYDAPMDTSEERKQNLADKVNELLSNEEKRKEFGEASYNKVMSTFSWDVTIKQIIENYKSKS